MSKVVKSVGKAISKVGKSVVKVAKKAWQNKFIRTALIATAVVFTAGLAVAPAASSIGTIFSSGASAIWTTASNVIGSAGTALKGAIDTAGAAITGAAGTAAPAAGGASPGIVGQLMGSKGGAALIEGGFKVASGLMADRAEQKQIQQQRNWQLEDKEAANANAIAGSRVPMPSYVQQPVNREQALRAAQMNPDAQAVEVAPAPTQAPAVPTYSMTPADPSATANPYGEFALQQPRGIYQVARRA